MKPAPTMSFDDACRAVIRAAAWAKPTALIQYAASYAEAGIGMTGEDARVQALYILNNLSEWRAPEAKAVRAALRHTASSN